MNNTVSSYRPLTLSYQSTDVLTVSNNGKVNCQSLQTNHIDGILIYSGATKNAQITSNGNITTSGSLRIDGTNSNGTDAISFHDNATGTKLWSIYYSGLGVLTSLALKGDGLSIYSTGATVANLEMNTQGRIYCK